MGNWPSSSGGGFQEKSELIYTSDTVIMLVQIYKRQSKKLVAKNRKREKHFELVKAKRLAMVEEKRFGSNN